MNNENTRKLTGVIDLLLESSSRINEAKPRRYWYPLSMASYGIEEIMEALDSMCSFRTSMWEKTLQFERKFSAYQGCNDAVMVNSGSSADLLLCFMLTNPHRPLLKPGDEILVPVVTWPTQIWSAMMAGLKVRLVDVNPETLNICLDDLESRITPTTKAIFLVHLMGNPCDMERVQLLAEKHSLLVLEDCCESLGSEWNGRRVGNFGVGGTFSFFFSHHITTMEGGMITCQDGEAADLCRLLRSHGWVRNIDAAPYHLSNYDIDPRYAFVNWGFNLRPTEIQAGFGLQQLSKLPAFNQKRAELAKKFFSFIETTSFLSCPKVHASAQPAWFALPLMLKHDAPFSKNEIANYFESEGVETRPIVSGNLGKHPVASLFKEFTENTFPGADTIHQRGFYIGLSPFQTDDCMDRLFECFHRFLNRY